MPDRCCVPYCKSNYGSTRKSQDYVSVFRFPSDKILFNKWVKAIPRKNWTPSQRSVVCAKHFESQLILTSHPYKNSSGKSVIFYYDRPKLKSNAYPTIFPDTPTYVMGQVDHSKGTSKYHRIETQEICVKDEMHEAKPKSEPEDTPNNNQEDFCVGDYKQFGNGTINDNILNFKQFKENLPSMIDKYNTDNNSEFEFKIKTSDIVVIYKMNYESMKCDFYIEISETLVPKIHVQHEPLSIAEVQCIVGENLSNWLKFTELLEYVSLKNVTSSMGSQSAVFKIES